MLITTGRGSDLREVTPGRVRAAQRLAVRALEDGAVPGQDDGGHPLPPARDPRRWRRPGWTSRRSSRTSVGRGFGIRDGNGIVFINHDGTVNPSGFLPIPLGNVREASIVDLYRDHPVMRALRKPGGLQGPLRRLRVRARLRRLACAAPMPGPATRSSRTRSARTCRRARRQYGCRRRAASGVTASTARLRPDDERPRHRRWDHGSRRRARPGPRRRSGHARRGRRRAWAARWRPSASTGSSSSTGPDSFLATRPAAVSLARELGLGDDLIGHAGPAGRLHPPPRLARADAGGPGPRAADAGDAVRADAAVLVAREGRGWRWTSSRRGRSGRTTWRWARSCARAWARRSWTASRARWWAGSTGRRSTSSASTPSCPQLRTAERRAPEPAARRPRRRASDAPCAARGRRRARQAAAEAGRRAPGSKPLGVFVSLRGGMDTLIDALAASAAAAGADLRTGLRGADAGPRRVRRRGAVRRRDRPRGSTPSSSPRRRPSPRSCSTTRLPGAARALDGDPARDEHPRHARVSAGRRRAPDLVGHGYLVPPSEGGAISRLHVVVARSGRAARPTAPSCSGCSSATRGPGRRCRTRRWSPQPAPTRSARSGSPASRSSSARRAGRTRCRATRWVTSRRVAAIEAAVGAWPAVTVAGASYRGVGLPDCVSQGQAAAASVAARLRADAVEGELDARLQRAVALAECGQVAGLVQTGTRHRSPVVVGGAGPDRGPGRRRAGEPLVAAVRAPRDDTGVAG